MRTAVQELLGIVQHLQQFGVAQDHQRHHVIAVQIRVQDQVGLVAHRGQQLTPLAQQLVARPALRKRITQRRQRGLEGGAHRCAVERRIVLGPYRFQPPEQWRHGGGCPLRQKPLQQAIAHHLDILGAHHFLAGKVDRQVLFMDQDARHINHCGEVKQVNQHELAPDAEPAQPAGNTMHECHGCKAALQMPIGCRDTKG